MGRPATKIVAVKKRVIVDVSVVAGGRQAAMSFLCGSGLAIQRCLFGQGEVGVNRGECLAEADWRIGGADDDIYAERGDVFRQRKPAVQGRGTESEGWIPDESFVGTVFPKVEIARSKQK